MQEQLTEGMIGTIQSAAALLTGFRRRRFQAEMAVKYCGGSARHAETVFGWGRGAVETGLNELRTGIRCLDAVHSRGRRRAEDKSPRLAEDIRRLAEPHSQADPKFQTRLAFTRVTAKAVRDELRRQDSTREDVPCVQTVGRVLNRLGYSLRKVLKAKPQKRSQRPTPSSTTSGRLTNERNKTRRACESPSTPRPR